VAELLVDATQLTRIYRTGKVPRTVLGPLSFQIRSGERIALVGPSGSGKSTLLNLIAALDQPSMGSIAWPALGWPEDLRPWKVGCVFQMATLLGALNVFENVELPLQLAGLPGDAQEMTRLTLERFGLLDLAGRLPEELSGGQSQCIAIARALAIRPRLLLADEPTSQLDRSTAARILDAILDICASADTAIVLATHDPFVASRMDRAWQLDRGRLTAEARAL
jgi:ABC-type lipoprotein export system ATPase subunit